MSMLQNAAIKAGITGAVAGIGSMVLYGQNSDISVPLFGRDVSAPVAVGAAAAVGSVAADAAHYWVAPHIPAGGKFQNIETAALGITAAGMGTMVTINQLGGAGESSMQAFMLGAGSYVAGDYFAEKFFPAAGQSFYLF